MHHQHTVSKFSAVSYKQPSHHIRKEFNLHDPSPFQLI